MFRLNSLARVAPRVRPSAVPRLGGALARPFSSIVFETQVEGESMGVMRGAGSRNPVPMNLPTHPGLYQKYRQEMERVWNKSWLFACHSNEIKNHGDYVTMNIGNNPIVIVRNREGVAKGFHNVCRHRGSKVCLKDKGHAKRLVCPYHQWAFNCDGELRSGRLTEDLDKSKLGLKPVTTKEMDGLVFFNIGGNEDFEPARKHISPHLAIQNLKQAKVAHQVEYLIHSDWKLVYENNRECYHCAGTHPEYIKVNYDTSFSYVPPADPAKKKALQQEWSREVTNEATKAEIEKRTEQCNKDWVAMGVPMAEMAGTSWPGDGFYKVSRVVMKEGFLTETLDGTLGSTMLLAKPPKMPPKAKEHEDGGSFTGPNPFDLGSLRVHMFPNFWIHAMGDHAVSTRLVPESPSSTRALVTWLVHEDAELGKHYEIPRLVALWKATAEQDWEICENQQLGVLSDGFEPGPLILEKEFGVHQFQRWVEKKLKTL